MSSDHGENMNMRSRFCLCLWLATVFGFGLPDVASAQESLSDEVLESIMQDYWEAQIQAFPLAASEFGEHRYRDRIDDLSPEALHANKARLDETIKLLAEIAPEALNERSRENYDAFHWMLTHERRNLDFKTGYFTFNTLGGWHTAFPRVVLITPYSTEKDYRDLLKRLQAFATYAQQNMDLMRLGIETGYTQPCELLKDYEITITGYIASTPEESVFVRPFDAMPDSSRRRTASTCAPKHCAWSKKSFTPPTKPLRASLSTLIARRVGKLLDSPRCPVAAKPTTMPCVTTPVWTRTRDACTP